MNRENMLIEASDLAAIINDSNLRLFDATFAINPAAPLGNHEHYLSAHIPGAAFLDHFELSDKNSQHMFMVASENDLARRLGEYGISNKTEVVIYSRQHIMGATRAYWVLRYAGHDHIKILNGGLTGWQAAGYDVEEGDSCYDPVHFSVDLRRAMFASQQDVINAMTDADVCTLNSLPSSYYEGDPDVPYTAQGHITGSISHPCNDLMDGEVFLTDTELVEKLHAKTSGKRMIAYCGGGIAATVNAFAALMVGQEDAAVYDGSLSEWISAELPTTLGTAPGEI